MTEGQARQAIADAAVAFFERCAGTSTYRQPRPYPPGLYDPDARDSLDCSSTATLIYTEAGQPDPNGRGFDGFGFTGSLVGQGQRVDAILPGDLVFYGDPFGRTGHVTTAIGGGMCVSFGSTPISRREVNDRPITQVRRYALTVAEPVPAFYEPGTHGKFPVRRGPWDTPERRDRELRRRTAESDAPLRAFEGLARSSYPA